MQADVIGLMELENNLEAENRIVAALNKEIGKQVFKGCGLPRGFRDAPGGQNAIRVGIIYRTDRVSTAGAVSMIKDKAFYSARTPIVQWFKSKSEGKPFGVIVNHFKAKGGGDRADVADSEQFCVVMDGSRRSPFLNPVEEANSCMKAAKKRTLFL